MRRLVISSDVHKALGQDGVRRLVHGPTLKIVECSVWGKAEDVDQGVAICVSVEVGGKMTRTRFTHQACAPSIVIPSHPDDYWDRLSNLTAKTIIWGEAAVLLFEPEMPVLGRPVGDGGMTGTIKTTVEERGFAYGDL
jgi:hypothetical protein